MFEDKIRRTAAQLQHDGFRAMSERITAKRMAWLDQVLPASKPRQDFSPRDVYELLFAEQMGLDLDELPIVSETPDEVVWRSYNRCSLLEACVALGWDTRRVCRPVNEKATQAFVSRINPEFRFHRSYTEIRPLADFCRERIIRVDFQAQMRLAIQEAQAAKSEGNPARGALVSFEGRVIGQAGDATASQRDPSAHAVISAIRQASQALGDPDLTGAILFSTCESCPMCASLAAWANVTAIVYGVSAAELAELGQPGMGISASEVVERSPFVVEIVPGVLRGECMALYPRVP